jgi:transposase
MAPSIMPRIPQTLTFTQQERAQLLAFRRSRSVDQRRSIRAAILLDAAAGLSHAAIARAHQVNRHTVELCIQKCRRFGWQVALQQLPRSGKPPRFPKAAIGWVAGQARLSPQVFGYPQECWTYRLLTDHIHRNAAAAGYPELVQLSISKLHRILNPATLQPRQVRFYVKRREARFHAQTAVVLHLHRDLHIRPRSSAGRQPWVTVWLLAGLDLQNGKITEMVSYTHESHDFIEFLKKLDTAYAAARTVRLIVDHHPAHRSQKTQAYLASRPQRFQFVFEPQQGAWLNLVETLFNQLTHSLFDQTGDGHPTEVVYRLHGGFEEVTTLPVVQHWKALREAIDNV